ncbi:MAG: hypothetical protein SGPRY_010952 [Prymnesium sp.]
MSSWQIALGLAGLALLVGGIFTGFLGEWRRHLSDESVHSENRQPRADKEQPTNTNQNRAAHNRVSATGPFAA